MKATMSYRPALENLEDRLTPTVQLIKPALLFPGSAQGAAPHDADELEQQLRDAA